MRSNRNTYMRGYMRKYREEHPERCSYPNNPPDRHRLNARKRSQVAGTRKFSDSWYSRCVFYVYAHVDPAFPDTFLYVGSGTAHRAWWVNGRGAAHVAFMRQHDVLDVVKILSRGLTRDAALALERQYILDCWPRFNRKGVKAIDMVNDP